MLICMNEVNELIYLSKDMFSTLYWLSRQILSVMSNSIKWQILLFSYLRLYPYDKQNKITKFSPLDFCDRWCFYTLKGSLETGLKVKTVKGGRKGTEDVHIGHTDHILCMAISSDGKFLVSIDFKVVVFYYCCIVLLLFSLLSSLYLCNNNLKNPRVYKHSAWSNLFMAFSFWDFTKKFTSLIP